MGKRMADAGADAALNYWTDADFYGFCSAEPTTYAELSSTYKLADTVPTFDAIANGDVSGRKRGVQSKSGVVVDANGSINHAGLGKSADSTLRYVTTVQTQAVVVGGTVDASAWAIEVRDPA